MAWLDRISPIVLVPFAVLMALAPFTPEPHLVEKFTLLMAGDLTRLVDMFDVAWHLLPTILLGLKLYRLRSGD